MELLQALAVLGASDVPEHAVAEALWPDSEADAAQHALETTLYRLRRKLGAELVVQRQRRISLAPGRCGVDLLHLDFRLRASLDDLARPGAGANRARGDAMAVVALYRGPLLPGVDGPWATEARTRIRRKLARWLSALAALPADAADVRRALEAADPGLRAEATLLAG